MYVAKGTFVEVCAWLDGFYEGLKEGSPNAVREWDAFAEWLQSRFRHPRNWAWSGIFVTKFPEDSVAFEQLRLLYREFLCENESFPTTSE